MRLSATVSCACELILLYSIVYSLVRNSRKVGLRLVTNLTANKYQATVSDRLCKTQNTLQRNSEWQTTVPTHAVKATAVAVSRGQQLSGGAQYTKPSQHKLRLSNCTLEQANIVNKRLSGQFTNVKTRGIHSYHCALEEYCQTTTADKQWIQQNTSRLHDCILHC